VAGALQLVELEQLLLELGFAEIQEQARFDAFRGTSMERVTTKYGVYGANLRAILR